MPKILERRLSIPSDPAEITAVELFLSTFAADAGIEEDPTGDILIAGTEVVNNAILHGNRSQPELKVHILVRHSPGLVEIRVDDEGKGFDLDSRPDPTSPTHLLDESGRGLLIIQHLMDEVRFEQGPAGQTAILIKRLG
ncbi:MAG: ATP-binding protein [Calditrichaeota bacterium]|nr:ATP-binding protein [Candidatus Cloacimonadota bacterium]MCA9785686.1 ATP-binding protein [Candidatus Cloacimonadota bacterium]MCB1045763.1 ATP-binding protein [Calditrichota bacterium]MCB9472241.1 ATP-binding protein [Candidatus Delongbacteria bacterium]